MLVALVSFIEAYRQLARYPQPLLEFQGSLILV